MIFRVMIDESGRGAGCARTLTHKRGLTSRLRDALRDGEQSEDGQHARVGEAGGALLGRDDAGGLFFCGWVC